MRLMSDATRLFVSLGGLVRRGIHGAKAVPRRQFAGEALILRDEAGHHFCIPIEVLPASAVSLEAAATIEQDFAADRLRFAFHSASLGPLEFLGVKDQALVVRNSRGAYFAISQGVLRAARVTPESASDLKGQLHPVEQPFRVEAGLLGKLYFLGSFQLSYVPDPQDAPKPSASALPVGPGFAAAPAHPELADARNAFFQNGWCTLSGAAFGHRLSMLVGEAEGLVRPASHEYEIASEDNLSIRIKRYATTGPVLESLHHDPVMLSALRALSGALVVPTQAAYYFYSGDDYISVHTDASHCPLTVLVRVYGDPPPLMIYPKLRGCPPEELQALADRAGGHLDTGEPMRFPHDGAIIFEGCELPHYRAAGAPGSGFVGVVQLCYRSVWSQTRQPRKMVADRPVTAAGTGSSPR